MYVSFSWHDIKMRIMDSYSLFLLCWHITWFLITNHVRVHSYVFLPRKFWTEKNERNKMRCDPAQSGPLLYFCLPLWNTIALEVRRGNNRHKRVTYNLMFLNATKQNIVFFIIMLAESYLSVWRKNNIKEEAMVLCLEKKGIKMKW